MSESTPQLSTEEMLTKLVKINKAIGFQAGRTSLRQEMLNIINENYNSSSLEQQTVFKLFSEALLDSFDRDNYEEATEASS
jgi:hypothetical protein